MRIIHVILFLFLSNALRAQLQNIEPDETEQQDLENLSEATESETKDEYYMQQMVTFKNRPLNINGSESALNEFPLLEPLQIANLLKYRQLLGDLISVYELQSVPGFSIDLIKKILPYITVAGNEIRLAGIKQLFHEGDRTLVIRPSIVPETSKGFSSSTPASQKYQGSRARMLLRYKYGYRDRLQYGIVADQDAGERFVFNRKQQGFDFYSIHLFARKLGMVKSLALGDYTVNLGQGLIHWQSLAFSMSSSVINIKRQSEILRPYHSAGEYNFLRGVGVTLKNGNWENTWFASYRRISANTDEDGNYGKVVTSIETSGLHRTAAEIEDRNTVAMTVAGANLTWKNNGGHLGINVVEYNYSLPLLKRDQPYNFYSIRGRSWSNYSVDYSFTFHNYHLFGEVAIDKSDHHAVLGGLMASLAPAVDLALLFRSISPAYQSIYGNAFTENSVPSNENGIYMAISIKPSVPLRIDAYTDLFTFPWLRYRVDAPGFGSQCFIQLTWQPYKKVEIYSRFRYKLKPLNETGSFQATNYPQDKVLRNWRTNISFQLNRDILLRSRIELCWFGDPGEKFPETGFLLYSDVLYKPFGKSYSVSARFQVFETGGYDTRLYAYENDVLFSNSTPAFFDKGARVYVNYKSKLNIKLPKGFKADLGIKVSSSVYSGQSSVGSGLDEIPGNRKTEMKVQLLFMSD